MRLQVSLQTEILPAKWRLSLQTEIIPANTREHITRPAGLVICSLSVSEPVFYFKTFTI